eukprot:TRINITY_DN21721_c0_g1_i1.p1 TRINITY_DN21721_c0_g1~~TRINITY_DN21721_c0_g1_i1.p1  ORF type:complete len:539 (+),score=96.49 TRINITY_DN21721_c0_g1_i1:33-1619(+)
MAPPTPAEDGASEELRGEGGPREGAGAASVGWRSRQRGRGGQAGARRKESAVAPGIAASAPDNRRCTAPDSAPPGLLEAGLEDASDMPSTRRFGAPGLIPTGDGPASDISGAWRPEAQQAMAHGLIPAGDAVDDSSPSRPMSSQTRALDVILAGEVASSDDSGQTQRPSTEIQAASDACAGRCDALAEMAPDRTHAAGAQAECGTNFSRTAPRQAEPATSISTEDASPAPDSSSGSSSSAMSSQVSPRWPAGTCTSVMVRNIPNRYKAEELLHDFHEEGFHGALDFFYLPIDFRTKRNRGYGFLNFISASWAERFRDHFASRKLTAYPSQKILEISPAETQGLEANVSKFLKTGACRVQNPWFKPILLVPCPSTGNGEAISAAKGASVRVVPLSKENLPEDLRQRLAGLDLPDLEVVTPGVREDNQEDDDDGGEDEIAEANEVLGEDGGGDQGLAEAMDLAVTRFLRPCRGASRPGCEERRRRKHGQSRADHPASAGVRSRQGNFDVCWDLLPSFGGPRRSVAPAAAI